MIEVKADGLEASFEALEREDEGVAALKQELALLKKRVKNAVEFISNFEQAVAHAAHERGADGVVCGHIHSAEIRQIGEVTYYNDGDWVESCTALVEHGDGRMEIIDWAERKRTEAVAARARTKAVVPT